MGDLSGIELILSRNGLILRRKGFRVIISDDLIEEGEFLPYAKLIGLYPMSDNCVREKTLWLCVRALNFLAGGPGSNHTKVIGFFFSLICYALFFVTALVS